MGVALIIVHDPGGVNAVRPVVEMLRAGHQLRVMVAVDGYAIRAMPGDAVPVTNLIQTEGDIGKFLDDLRPDVVLMSPGHAPSVPWERILLEARAVGIPTMLLLDHWVNVHSALASGHPLADVIAVPGVHARDRLVSLGAPVESILVSGNPHLDAVRAWAERRPRHPRRHDRPRVVFASEPMSRARTGNDQLAAGFDERDVLQVVLDACGRIAVKRNVDVELVVKPHPLEDAAVLLSGMVAPPRVVMTTATASDAPWPLVECADLVIGISSMLLVESILIGRPVLSVQPGLAREDANPLSRSGIIDAAYDETTLETKLDRLLFDEQAQRQRLALQSEAVPRSSATEMIVRALLILSRSRSQDVPK